MSQCPPPERIVVVAEDQLLVRMFASDFLDDAGYKVFEAAHADDALLLLDARPDVQVLMTDVEMAGGSMNGFELAQQARERWPRLGIVVMSGRAAPAPGDLPEGAVFIPKPYRPAAVLAAIESMSG
jgi:two-component system, response regulator PdtaR